MGPDPKPKDQQPVPDYIPEEFLQEYQSGARMLVRFRRVAPVSPDRARGTQGFRTGIKRFFGAMGHWLVLRTVLALLVTVSAPAIWLLTDPASEGLFISLSLLSTVAALAFLRQVVRWLYAHRSGFSWLLNEAGTPSTPS